MGRIIYLTGAPATGKSTLCGEISRRFPEVEYYSYSKLLRDVVNQRSAEGVDEAGIRRQSANIITPADVNATDERLINEVHAKRQSRHIIIDSHPVTKESYGFRVTPFRPENLLRLAPDVVVCAYADPQTIAARIKANPDGRPLPRDFELDMHNQLQAGMAAQYGFALGKTCYFLDTGLEIDVVCQRFIEITKIA